MGDLTLKELNEKIDGLAAQVAALLDRFPTQEKPDALSPHMVGTPEHGQELARCREILRTPGHKDHGKVRERMAAFGLA